VFADRYTTTGSIGVVLVKPSLEGWYRDHEVRQDQFDRGRYMRGWSWGRDWDAEIQAAADSSIMTSYQVFVRHVAEGRGMTEDQVHEVAQGRVWRGEDALQRKLVDEIGGLEAAIAEARRRAHVPEGERIRIAEYRRPLPSFLERVIGTAVRGVLERDTLPRPGAIYYWADPDDAE
jgi:protease-4